MTFTHFAAIYLLPFVVLVWGMIAGWMLRGLWDRICIRERR